MSTKQDAALARHPFLLGALPAQEIDRTCFSEQVTVPPCSLERGRSIASAQEWTMKRRLISTGSPFERVAGYSRAVVQGDWCFVAGTTGYDYALMEMPDEVPAQVENALATIAKALEEAGFAMTDVVRVHYYVTDADFADAVFAVTGRVFGGIRPAATILVCDLLKPEMKVEIEATAFRG
jgi:enamine deaminase RidA (YjgF/YER057c/UK114 family)